METNNIAQMRAAFENTPILRLQTAARMAGLRFKNGAMGKAEIIERLCQFPAIGSACLAVLKREEAEGGAPAPAPKPAPKAPAGDDWSDTWEPAPTPAPQNPPFEVGQVWEARNGELWVVEKVDSDINLQYPIVARSNRKDYVETFTRQGKQYVSYNESASDLIRCVSRQNTPTPPPSKPEGIKTGVDLSEIRALLEQYVKKTEHFGQVSILRRETSEGDAATIAEILRMAKAGEIPGMGETHFHFPDAAKDFKTEGLTHPELPNLIRVLLAGEQAFLKGPAGSGKTTAAKQAREALAAAFGRADLPLYATGAIADSFALIGYKNATGEYVRTAFREAVEFGGLFLWDEIDGSAPDAQLVVNALDNGFIAFPDATVNLHPHFRLIAGGNTDGSGATMEYAGRARMDGAFRDRFAIIEWNLDPRIEAHLSRGDSRWLEAVRAVRQFATDREIMDVVATARAVRRGPLFLHQGMPRDKVLEVTCKRGALVESWGDVLRLPAVREFLTHQGA